MAASVVANGIGEPPMASEVEGQSPSSSSTAQPSNSTTGHVLLKDVAHLVRLGVVAVPGGFTKLGHPLIYFPDVTDDFVTVLESDLHLLFKYYLAVVPRSEQSSGFSLIIDRRLDEWAAVRVVFQKVITLFPARIREVYLLHGPRGLAKDVIVNQLIEDFLLDFDIYHLNEPAELLHYIDNKYVPAELGGTYVGAIEEWILLQEHVESFSFSARRIARRLAQFVGVLNQEDVGHFRSANDSLRELAAKNRSCYRRLRKELEELTDHGLRMLKNLQRPDANVMQRLAVQLLCKQLDQAWTYFNRSWKMQDHVYVQYLELNSFQTRFRELTSTLANHERELRELPTAATSTEEANAALDRLDSCAQGMAVEGAKARELAKLGQELLSDHRFATDCVQPKCAELRRLCQKLELLMADKRRTLHKFLDLVDGVEAANKWCATAIEHLEREEEIVVVQQRDEDVFSQIRQIDYLLSKSRELKLRTRRDFEEAFDDIKDLMSAQNVFAVDDALDQLEAVTVKVMHRREELRARATRSEKKFSPNGVNGGSVGSSSSGLGSSGVGISGDSESESSKIRRENILAELLSTESRYVDDLEQILVNYRDKLTVSNLTETRHRANILFGNLDEIHSFHAGVLFPELERCGANPAAVARIFMVHCAAEMRTLYAAYCQNMPAARQAITDLGGEASPASILHHCQTEAGHQLPLSSYLLKPMQRLTKYQLLLKDLADSSNVVCGKADLEEALAELLGVVKTVNDSLHSVTIRGLPQAANPLGPLITHNVFQVTSENKSQTQILFRNRSQRRHVFLYENHTVFAKLVNEKAALYQFKMCLATANLGMSSVVRSDDKKLELWVHGRNDLYTLEAVKGRKAKEDFAAELRKVIIRQKDHQRNAQQRSHGKNVFYVDTASSASESSDPVVAAANAAAAAAAAHSSRLTRSRSLESGRGRNHLRSRSLDCAADRSSPEGDEEAVSGHRYVVLADYMALTSREIDLNEDEIVELVKVGCAGWWYVRITTYPYPEGWAPSTYLEKLMHPDTSNA